MKGAIIGDVVGSVYEFNNIKTKDFPLLTERNHFTDDTVMTVAVGMGLLAARKTGADLIGALTASMRGIGRHYPSCGYGARFWDWLLSPRPKPYNSWGNGAAMRCSSAGMLASGPEQAFVLGMYTAGPTHNHPESMEAAGVTAALIWLARHGSGKEALRETAEKYYTLPALDALRPTYTYDISCAGTMPVALSAFFESESFEDTIRNAVSVGGDSDTIAAIAGSIAEAYYGVPAELWEQVVPYLSKDLAEKVAEFYGALEEAVPG